MPVGVHSRLLSGSVCHPRSSQDSGVVGPTFALHDAAVLGFCPSECSRLAPVGHVTGSLLALDDQVTESQRASDGHAKDSHLARDGTDHVTVRHLVLDGHVTDSHLVPEVSNFRFAFGVYLG